jgi:predicted ATPase
MEQVYLEHGYRLIEVPAGTVAQRVRQVLRVITI